MNQSLCPPQCHEVTNLPSIKYNFVALDALETLNKDAICGEFAFPLSSPCLFSMMERTDVIGIVKEASALGEITSSKLNRQVLSIDSWTVDASLITCFQLVKRELVLVDKTGFSVRMTLWGKQAEQYNDAEANPVIAFKGVKVGDFGGGVSTFPSL